MPVTKEEVEEKVGGCARSWSKSKSLTFVGVYYVLIIAASGGVIYAIGTFTDITADPDYPLFLAMIADILCTVLVWISAIAVNNSSMYDAYWSVFTPPAVIYWLLAAAADNKDVPVIRTILVCISVWVWGIRLTTNWARDWPGLHHEDYRYVNIHVDRANKYGEVGYWILGSFAGIMFFPTVLVFLGSIPTYYALYKGLSEGASELNALDYVATVIAVGAAIIQFVADEQMRNFRKSNPPKGACMESGLWRYSRHPNYFGEISFWFGCYLHALAANAAVFWWTGVGFILMTLLFVFISVPLMEERMLERRPNYANTIKSTSMLIPLPRFGKGNT